MRKCFVIGNGLSLWQTHPRRIPEHFATFGMNLLPKMYDLTHWRPDYYVACSDGINIPEYRDIFLRGIDECNLWSIMTPEVYTSCKRVLRDFKNLPDILPADAENLYWSNYQGYKPFSRWGTSALYVMQVAKAMGYSEIYLIGFDGNFRPIDKGFDPNHFVADYWGKYQRNRHKDSEFYKRMNRDHMKAHQMAFDASIKYGFRIINCTPNSAFTMYQQEAFDNVIQR